MDRDRGEPNLDILAMAARQALGLIGFEVSEQDAKPELQSILFGEERAWKAAEMGLNSHRETAQVVLAHLETWAVNRSGQPWPTRGENFDWTAPVELIENALFSKD